MNRKLQIKSTNSSAKSQTTTLNYVNPNATDAQLRTMSTMMIGLTDNTYDSANKIDTTALIAKAQRTISFSPSSATYAELAEAATSGNEPYALAVTINGNTTGQMPNFSISGASTGIERIVFGGTSNIMYVANVMNDPGGSVTITANFSATGTYDETSVNFIISQ